MLSKRIWLTKTRLRPLSVIAVFILIISVTLLWKNTRRNEGAQGQALPTAQVTKGNIEITLKGSGPLKASDTANIILKTNATVIKIHHKEGDLVKSGDLLYELQDDELKTALRKSELNLQQQQINLSEALKQELEMTTCAPMEGIIKTLSIKEGDYTGSNIVAATIINPNTTYIKAPFNGAQIQNIKVGQKARVLFLDSLRSVQGTVIKVGSTGIPEKNGVLHFYATISLDGDHYIEGQPRKAQVAVYINDDYYEQATESGTIEPHEVTEIRSKVGGTVLKLHVDEGSAVKQGQNLFSVTNDDLKINIEKQRIALEQAQIDYESKLIQVEDLRVRAPIDGLLLEQDVVEGDVIRSSDSSSQTSKSATTPAAVIVDYDKMSVVIAVDELDINKVEVGMPVKFTAEAIPSKTFEGFVEKISDLGVNQNNTATFDVTTALNKSQELKMGMTMDVEISVAKKENVLLLPIAGVQQRNGRSFVMAVDGEQPSQSKNTTVTSRSQGKTAEVKTGLSNEDFIEIQSGLNEGDQVFLSASSGSGSTGFRNFNMAPGPGPGMGVRVPR